MNKIDTIIWISVAIVVFLAIMDVKGFVMWQSMGDVGDQAYMKAEKHYMDFFWTFAYALIGIVALVYYLMKKDKSETIALVLIPMMLLWGGLEDILYFIISGKPLTTAMYWLNDNWFMGWIARTMGEQNVSGNTLVVSLGISIFAAYYVYKWLKNMPG